MSAALHVALLSPPGLPIEAFAHALAHRVQQAPLGLRASVLATRGSAPAGAGDDIVLHVGNDPAPLAHCESAVLLVPHDGTTGGAEDTLRAALLSGAARWSVVRGFDGQALEAALDAITPWLLQRPVGQAGRRGLFSRLEARQAAQPVWTWVCDTCDSPECEHAALQARRRVDEEGDRAAPGAGRP